MKKTAKKSSYRLPEVSTSFAKLVAEAMSWTEAEAMRLLVSIGVASIIGRMEGITPKCDDKNGKQALKRAVIEQITEMI